MNLMGREVTKSRAYNLCGWQTVSEIPFTGVRPLASDCRGADVTIQIASGRSPIRGSARGPVFDHSAECSLIRIENAADFLVSDGRQIDIWPAVGAARKDIEIFLCGPVWAALCHQRGILPLHASAVLTGRGVVAFAGHPGAGKSTTAAAMASLGYPLVADDIVPISLNGNSLPGAWPYLCRLKLHMSAIDEIGLTATEPVGDSLDKDKFFVVPRRRAARRWRRLERIYLLENDPTWSRISIERIDGAEVARALIDQTYHFQFILGTRCLGDHLAFCAAVAGKTPMYRVRRPSSLLTIGATVSAIRMHLEDPEAQTHPED